MSVSIAWEKERERKRERERERKKEKRKKRERKDKEKTKKRQTKEKEKKSTKMFGRMGRIDACFYVVLLATIIDMLGFSLTIPILANYAVDIQLKEYKDARCGYADFPNSLNETLFASKECEGIVNGYKAQTGVISSSYALAGVLSSIWMPLLSDKCGRKQAVMVSIFGSLSGFLLQAFADLPALQSFGFLLFARVWGGLFGGTVTVANAFVIDLYDKSQRGKKFVTIGMSMMMTFTFGGVVGGALAQISVVTPLYCAAGMSVLALVLCAIFVSDPKELVKKVNERKEEVLKKTAASVDHEAEETGAADVEGEKTKAFNPLANPQVWLIG